MKTQRGRRPAWQAHDGGAAMQANTHNPIVAPSTPPLSGSAQESSVDLLTYPVSSDTKLLFTITAAAEALSLSRAHLYRLVARGDVPSVLVGGRCRRISRAALERYVTRLEADGEGGAQ